HDVTPDHRNLAVSIGDRIGHGAEVFVWDLESDAAPRKFPRIPRIDESVPVSFLQDGKTLAVGGASSVRLWRWRAEETAPAEPKLEHEGEAWALAFSLDGSELATGGDDNRIRLWDSATGAPRASWFAHPDTVAALAYRPDGRVIASVGLG